MDENVIIKLHADGFTQRRMAVELGCGITTVRRYWRRLGLKGRSTGTRKFRLREDFFGDLEAEKPSYWLGFLLADGCLAKSAGTRRAVRVFLKESDGGHLKKLQAAIGHRGRLVADDREHPRKGLVFNSTGMSRRLLGLGWQRYKENGDPSIIGHVPDCSFRHFLRGYFDGDGCLSRWSGKTSSWYVNIVCRHAGPLRSMDERVHSAIGLSGAVRRRGSVHELKWNGGSRLAVLLDWLYDGATVFLDRKHARYDEFWGREVLRWRSMHDFELCIPQGDVRHRTDVHEVVDRVTGLVLEEGWSAPGWFDREGDLERLRGTDLGQFMDGQSIRNLHSAGNEVVCSFQPDVWRVSLNGQPPVAGLRSDLVRKGVERLFLNPGSRIGPRRLLREMMFVGMSRASLLGCPAVMAAVRTLDLSGRWVDPCAGWGNRLLASHVLGLDYWGTDPGICFPGLVGLRDYLGSSAVLLNSRWEDAGWPGDGFVFTSPPFWNKEDYLDGVDYGGFEEWAGSFVVGLIGRALEVGRTVLHLDGRLRDFVCSRFRARVVPLRSRNRVRSPVEFFVEVLGRR